VAQSLLAQERLSGALMSTIFRRKQTPAATCVAIAAMFAFIAACGRSASPEKNEKKLSIPEAEAGLSKMFSDTSGKAEFSCSDGGDRYDVICQGRYLPVDRNEPVIAHRIGASVSHYYEGKPVFAISVLRDRTAQK
jgi:hypothetical protein